MAFNWNAGTPLDEEKNKKFSWDSGSSSGQQAFQNSKPQEASSFANTSEQFENPVSKWADQTVEDHQKNLGYTTGITNPVGWLTEDVPVAAATAVSGVGKFLGGVGDLVTGAAGSFADTFTGKDNTENTGKFFQGGMDAISGVFQTLSSPAPLLPDFIEKPVTDVMSLPTKIADSSSNEIMSGVNSVLQHFGYEGDTNSPQAKLLTQSMENLVGALTLKGTAALGELKSNLKTAKSFDQPTTTPILKEGTFRPDVLKAAQETGIEAPVPLYNQTNIVKGLYSLSSKGFFGKPLQQQLITFTDNLHQYVSKFKDEISPVIDKKEAGVTILKSFDDYTKNIDEMRNQAYTQLKQRATGAPATVEGSMNVLSDIMEQSKLSALSNPLLPEMQKIHAAFEKGQTFDQLMATRTALGQKIGSAFNDPVANQNVGALKRLYGAMADDLDSTANAIDPDTGKIFTQANSLHKEYQNAMKGYFGKVFNDIDNIKKIGGEENIIDKFIKQDKFTHLPDLTDMLGQEGTAALKGGFIVSIVEKANKSGKFSPETFATEIGKYENAARTLFNDGEYHKLNNVKLLADAFKPISKISEGSQTGFLNYANIQSSGVGGAALSALTGNYGAAVGILGATLSTDALSVLFRTKLGRRILGSEESVPLVDKTVKAVGKAKEVVSPIGKEAKRQLQFVRQDNKEKEEL